MEENKKSLDELTEELKQARKEARSINAKIVKISSKIAEEKFKNIDFKSYIGKCFSDEDYQDEGKSVDVTIYKIINIGTGHVVLQTNPAFKVIRMLFSRDEQDVYEIHSIDYEFVPFFKLQELKEISSNEFNKRLSEGIKSIIDIATASSERLKSNTPNYFLKQTSLACPEQYDVYESEEA